MTTNITTATLRSPVRKAPGPRGYKAIETYRRMRQDPLGTLLGLTETHGDLIRLRFGPKVVFLLNHPDYVAHVLQANRKNYDRDTYMNSLAKRLLGRRGLSALEGTDWAKQRRILQPIFRKQTLVSYVPVMQAETQAVLDRWTRQTEMHEEIDLAEDTARLSLAISARVLFGLDLTSDLEEVVHHDFLGLSADLTDRLMSLLPLPPVLPTARDRRWRRSIQRLDAKMEDVIRQRRNSGARKDDLLGLLISARDPETGVGLDDEEIRDHVKTFMLGGYETTAHALAWTLYLLARHPEVRTQVEREADELLVGDSVDPQRLEGAKWTRAAFEESLRLYPPGWMTARRAKDADVIGGYAIAAGSDVLLCPYTMHRNPKLWDSPRRFDPQRFLSSTTPRNRYAFFPFGGGPQMCIGKTFALLQAQVVLSMVSKRFRFDIAPDHRVVPEALLTLRAKYGIRGHMNPRNTFNTPKDEPALARS